MEFRILLLTLPVLVFSTDTPYDFGVLENENLLRTLLQEDQILTTKLRELNDQHHDFYLDRFIRNQTINLGDQSISSYIQHPINSFQLIKKYAVVFPAVLENVKPELVNNNIIKEQLLKNTTMETLSEEDLVRAMNGLVNMIHSHQLDVDKFSKGEIPGFKHGNKGESLRSDSFLYTDDLLNLATQARNEYGYLGRF